MQGDLSYISIIILCGRCIAYQKVAEHAAAALVAMSIACIGQLP